MGIRASASEESDLELDVREALKAMDLPVSPLGAQTALVQIGRWSEGDSNTVKLQPWTDAVLEVSRSYKEMDQERRRELLKQTTSPETRAQYLKDGSI